MQRNRTIKGEKEEDRKERKKKDRNKGLKWNCLPKNHRITPSPKSERDTVILYIQPKYTGQVGNF
jgi:hypothetical protein